MKGDDGTAGSGVRFERIRRITGYLVGTVDRFNDAKRAEERDRVKHGSMEKLITPSAFDAQDAKNQKKGGHFPWKN